MILLPPSPKCWIYRYEPLYPGWTFKSHMDCHPPVLTSLLTPHGQLDNSRGHLPSSRNSHRGCFLATHLLWALINHWNSTPTATPSSWVCPCPSHLLLFRLAISSSHITPLSWFKSLLHPVTFSLLMKYSLCSTSFTAVNHANQASTPK